MLGQSLSLALLSLAGLAYGLPTEKRQELGEAKLPVRDLQGAPLAKRDLAAMCDEAKLLEQSFALGLILEDYDQDDVPYSIYLLALNFVKTLQACGYSVSVDDVFEFGPPITGGINPDPTVPGGPLEPEVPVEGGQMQPDPTVPGGSIEPDTPVEGGSLVPEPYVTVTLTPGSVEEGGEVVADPVETAAAAPAKEKRQWSFGPPKTGPIIADPVTPPSGFWPGKKEKRTDIELEIGAPIKVGDMVPDVPVGTSLWPGKKDKRADVELELGAPIKVGDLVPDVPISSSLWPGKKDKRTEKENWFWIGKPIKVGDLVPDIPFTSSPKNKRDSLHEKRTCGGPLAESIIQLESTYGKACDGKLGEAEKMMQQALVMALYKKCGKLWEGWQIIELDGGVISMGPVYSTGPYPSD